MLRWDWEGIGAECILAPKFTALEAKEVRCCWITVVVEPTASFARRKCLRGLSSRTQPTFSL